MPGSDRRRLEFKTAQFVGGPLDGQRLPVLAEPHACVLRSSVDVNGTTIRWHWYRLEEGESPTWGSDFRYRFVVSETGDWPSDSMPEEGV